MKKKRMARSIRIRIKVYFLLPTNCIFWSSLLSTRKVNRSNSYWKTPAREVRDESLVELPFILFSDWSTITQKVYITGSQTFLFGFRNISYILSFWKESISHLEIASSLGLIKPMIIVKSLRWRLCHENSFIHSFIWSFWTWPHFETEGFGTRKWSCDCWSTKRPR